MAIGILDEEGNLQAEEGNLQAEDHAPVEVAEERENEQEEAKGTAIALRR